MQNNWLHLYNFILVKINSALYFATDEKILFLSHHSVAADLPIISAKLFQCDLGEISDFHPIKIFNK